MLRWLWMVLAIALLSVRAQAQRMVEDDVPPELRPWIPWVKDEPRDEGCRLVDDQAVCVWPGLLTLRLGRQGGTFSQEAVANVETTLVLPGDAERWPQDVRIGKKGAVVFDADGLPAVKVPPGSHEITGKFQWKRLPDRLMIPRRTGLVELFVDDKAVAFPERGDDGLRIDSKGLAPEPDQPTVTEGEEREPEPDRVSLQVFRHVEDGIPLRITTHLRLRISGSVREENLGDVLLAGSEALALEGPLSLQMKESRELLAQVRPGTYDVRVVARLEKPVPKLVAPKRGEPWPDHEIWVWTPNLMYRQVELGGATPTDPTRTDLPDEWKSLTAFRLAPGDALSFSVVRRGVPDPPPNDLRLNRELWMDLDGGGFSVRDRISGSMHQGWRLDLLAGKLGRAEVGGEARLITTGASERRGVELRERNVNLLAEWRAGAGTSVPAAGWSEDFEGATATLHLPPGWELFHVSGVDDHSRTWIDSWRLTDALFILLIAVVAAKVTHPLWGAVALAGLVLAHGIPGAPGATFIALLIAAALRRVVPAGRIKKVVALSWWAAALVLGVELGSFVAAELERGFYPTDDTYRVQQYRHSLDGLVAKQDLAPASPEPMMEVEELPTAELDDREGGTGTRAKGEEGVMGRAERKDKSKRYAIRGGRGGGSYAPGDVDSLLRSSRDDAALVAQKAQLLQAAQQAEQQKQTSIVQTGEGTPTWDGATWRFEWLSAVEGDQQARLWLVSPGLQRVLSVLRVVLLGFLAFGILRASRRDPPGGTASGAAAGPAARAAAAAAVLSSLLIAPRPAAAAPPSPEILEELGRRLNRDPLLAPQPDCHPNCVSVSKLEGTLEGRRMTLDADVHAAGPTTYALPGPANTWVPTEVTVDGKATRAIALTDDGRLRVRLDPGRHAIEMVGPIGSGEVSLDLGSAPKRVVFSGKGWSVDGIDENQQAVSVQLSYVGGDFEEATEDGVEARGPTTLQALPTWLTVTRELTLGVTWLVTTTVRRVSPGPAPIVVKIPLLPDERVTTPGIQVEKKHAVVTLGATATPVPLDGVGGPSASWVSVLKGAESLQLVAPSDRPWTESWSLGCSPIWHCETAGLAPIRHAREDAWSPVFSPWPGETLKLTATRPGAAEGASVTIDRARLVLRPGPRQTDAELDLSVRSSTIGNQEVHLPEGASVQAATLDGTAIPVRKDQTKLDVALGPGSHRLSVTFRTNETSALMTKTPAIRLGRAAVNAEVNVVPEGDRIAIAFGGPGSGPTMKLYGWLALLVFAGLVAGNLPWSPLSRPVWVALLIGLTQAEGEVVVMIIAWFFAMQWRRRTRDLSPWQHNLVQAALATFTGVAVLGLFVGAMGALTRRPDLGIVGSPLGPGPHEGRLFWYVDRIGDTIPTAWVATVPTWTWNGVHVVWALWVAWSLIGWSKWAWESYSSGGAWRKMAWPLFARQPAVPAGSAPVSSGEPRESDQGPSDDGGRSEARDDAAGDEGTSPDAESDAKDES